MKNGSRGIWWFAGGALFGAATVFLLMPGSRREMRRRLESWLGEEDPNWPEEIEQEAAATEGGRAGTREWQSAQAASPSR